MIRIGSAGAEHDFESFEEASEYLERLQCTKTVELTVVAGEGTSRELMKVAFDPTAESLEHALERAQQEYLDRELGLPKGRFVEKKEFKEF